MFHALFQTLPTIETGHRPTVWQRIALLVLAVAGLLLDPVLARAEHPPQVLLFGATLDEARGFAVDTASSRGWSILSVTSNTAVFEQSLDADDDDEDAENHHLLRIYADFAEESSGVRVALRAEEVEHSETADESMTDVTGRYADNLSNALSSLRGKWDARRESPGAAASAASAAPPVSMGKLSAKHVGAWAYTAERYAESRGCELTDRPTQLVASGPDGEQHLVFCRNGTSLRVDCRHGDCTTAP